MATPQTISRTISILCQPGQSVKARIAGAGIHQGKLAKLAGISQGTLSTYLAGKRRNALCQLRIARAFRKLSGQKISTVDFWADLWAEAAA